MNLTREEKIIANTGLGIMIRLMEDKDPILLNYLIGHPEKQLLTLENILKLNKKFQTKEVF